MPSTSGTNWFISNALTGQNLGENVITGAGGQSLREAFITATGNLDNTVAAEVAQSYTQYQFANNIFALKGAVAGEGSRRYGLVDFGAYGSHEYTADELIETVTGAFNVLTHSSSAIILGTAQKGPLYIQDDSLNSFYRSDSQQTLRINASGFRDSGEAAGLTQVRDLAIGDGKGAIFAAFSGLTQSLVLGGPVDVTASAHTKLHVSGNVNILGGLTAGSTSLVIDDTTGFVAMGCTADAHRLTVLGSISSSNSGYFGQAVGIGTAEIGPHRLTVSGGADNLAKFFSTDDLACIEIADNDSTGYINIKDSYFSIGGTSGLGSTNNLNVLLSGASAHVGIGTSQFGVGDNQDVNLAVKGSISADSISTDQFYITDTFYSANNNQLGNDLTDEQTFWGNVYVNPVTQATPLTLSGSATSVTMFVDEGTAKGGGLVVSGSTWIRNGLGIGGGTENPASEDAPSKLDLGTYDLYIKGTKGITLFEAASYELRNVGTGTFSIAQKNGANTHALNINGDKISLEGSAVGAVKAAIGTAPDNVGLKIHGGSSDQALRIVSAGTNKMYIGPDGASQNNEINAYEGDLDLWAKSNARHIGLNLTDNSGFVNIHNESAGDWNHDLMIKRSGTDPSGYWAIGAESSADDLYLQVGGSTILGMNSDKVIAYKPIENWLDGGGYPVPFIVYNKIYENTGFNLTKTINIPIAGYYRMDISFRIDFSSDDENRYHQIVGEIGGKDLINSYIYLGGHGTYKRSDNWWSSGFGIGYLSSPGAKTLKVRRGSAGAYGTTYVWSVQVAYAGPGSGASEKMYG